MRFTLQILTLTFFLIIIIISCKKEEDETQAIEISVETTDALNGPEGGVYLSGSYIINGTTITAKGFRYSIFSNFGYNDPIVYDESSSSNSINYFLATGIEDSVRYYFKAFIETEYDTVYGQALSFMSDGSVSPRIDSLSSEFGHINDTISIYGEYFINTYPNRTKVFFATKQADIVSISDSLIRCIVPENMLVVVSAIMVKADNKVDIYGSFTLYAPLIGSIEPIMAHFGDTVFIEGDHFDTDTIRTKVHFGNVEARLVYSTRKLIKVLVPINLENSLEPIKVSSQAQQTVYGNNFSLTPPEFNFDLHEVYANQELTIEGDYFHPVLNKNIVTFEGVEAEIVWGDKDHLHVRVPLGPYPRKKAILKLQVLDIVIEYEYDLDLLDKWIMVSNSLPFRYNRSLNNAVIASNTAYVIATDEDLFNDNKYLWKFDPEDYSWEQSLITFPMKWTGVSISGGERIYVYTAEEDGAFWEYNPYSQHWIQKAPFPGERRDGATQFEISGYVYVGMGSNFYSGEEYADFYKYSPASDTWMQIADFTYQTYFRRIETSSFTIDDIAYIGAGASNTGMYDYWSYHPSSDEWIQIADFIDARKYAASFVRLGYGHISGGSNIGGPRKKECWKYVPASDSWIQVEDIGHIPRHGHFAFSLNNKTYFGGGSINLGSDQAYDFYEYNE